MRHISCAHLLRLGGGGREDFGGGPAPALWRWRGMDNDVTCEVNGGEKASEREKFGKSKKVFLGSRYVRSNGRFARLTLSGINRFRSRVAMQLLTTLGRAFLRRWNC